MRIFCTGNDSMNISDILHIALSDLLFTYSIPKVSIDKADNLSEDISNPEVRISDIPTACEEDIPYRYRK